MYYLTIYNVQIKKQISIYSTANFGMMPTDEMLADILDTTPEKIYEAKKCMEELDMKPNTFYRRVKEAGL